MNNITNFVFNPYLMNLVKQSIEKVRGKNHTLNVFSKDFTLTFQLDN